MHDVKANKRTLALRVGEVMFVGKFVWQFREVRLGKAIFDVWRTDGRRAWQEHDVAKILKRRPDYAGAMSQSHPRADGEIKAVVVSRRSG